MKTLQKLLALAAWIAIIFAIDREADEKRVLDNFRIIHEWIMQGKYGKGQLVN